MSDEKSVKPLSEEEWRLKILLCLQNVDISVERIANAANAKLPQDAEQ